MLLQDVRSLKNLVLSFRPWIWYAKMAGLPKLNSMESLKWTATKSAMQHPATT
jgi:hypothetical protein